MDEGERAFHLEQASVASALNQSRTFTSYLKPTGYCHHCDEEVGDKQLFCNSDCAKEYDKKNARHRKVS